MHGREVGACMTGGMCGRRVCMVGGGVCRRGACVVGGGGSCIAGGHAWQGCVWWGACMVGGMYGRRVMCGGECAW